MVDRGSGEGNYIIVGKRRLGMEFMIALISYIASFLLGHWVTALPGLERTVFYIVGTYNVLMYLMIAFSDPGWLSSA